jgi:hypothetical protein
MSAEGAHVITVSLHPGAIPDSDLGRHLPENFFKDMFKNVSAAGGVPVASTATKNIKQGVQ